jgi:hypothetical protein
MQLKNPSIVFRACVLGVSRKTMIVRSLNKKATTQAQGIFWNFFFFSYLVSPRFCHSFVGYLEEEAVKTYTGAIEALDAGKLPNWKTMPYVTFYLLMVSYSIVLLLFCFLVTLNDDFSISFCVLIFLNNCRCV